MELLGLHHISIAVKDVERSKKFYGEFLGLSEIDRPNFDFAGAWYQLGEQQLHLIAYPDSKTIRDTEEIFTRESHFAIRVRGYEQTLHHLKRHEVPYFENKATKSGFLQIFCLDPDNHIIELNVER